MIGRRTTRELKAALRAEGHKPAFVGRNIVGNQWCSEAGCGRCFCHYRMFDGDPPPFIWSCRTHQCRDLQAARPSEPAGEYLTVRR